MKLYKTILLSFFASISFSKTVIAAPGDVRGNFAEWPVVPIDPGSSPVSVQGLLTPVFQSPGQIGTLRFAHDLQRGCALVVLGGSGTPQQVSDALNSEGKVGLNKLGNKAFSLIICDWTVPNGARVVVANKASIRQAVRGVGAVRPGALFAVKLDRPGTMGHVSLSNSHGSNGARYYSDEYELVIATEGDGMMYLIIIDKVQSKLIVVSRQGIWQGEWNSQTRLAFSQSMGPTLAGLGRVLVTNK